MAEPGAQVQPVGFAICVTKGGRWPEILGGRGAASATVAGACRNT